jgi:hypothetical protein
MDYSTNQDKIIRYSNRVELDEIYSLAFSKLTLVSPNEILRSLSLPNFRQNGGQEKSKSEETGEPQILVC